MFFNRNKFEKKISQIDNQLKSSFGNVKNDTNVIFQWLDYFYKQNLEQQNIIQNLQQELTFIPKTREELKQLLDQYYSYEPILNKIRELDDKVESIRKDRMLEGDSTIRRIKEIEERIESLKRQKMEGIGTIKDTYELDIVKERLNKLEKRKVAFKEKIIKKITKNSKDYIKTVIISYIKKYEKITALQLKEMVVEEQGLCSKSSFYRILEEIEQMEEIATVRKGKEKQYMAKNLKLQ